MVQGKLLLFDQIFKKRVDGVYVFATFAANIYRFKP